MADEESPTRLDLRAEADPPTLMALWRHIKHDQPRIPSSLNIHEDGEDAGTVMQEGDLDGVCIYVVCLKPWDDSKEDVGGIQDLFHVFCLVNIQYPYVIVV